MASIINTGSIDTGFPIAGQDNDSQGFRDNFTNTNTNFEAAKLEIEDLQGKVVLKAALSGDVLDNDMADAIIKNVQVQGLRGTVIDTATNTGPVEIDVTAAPFQRVTPVAPIDLSFTNLAPLLRHIAVRVQITITDTAYTVTLPGAVTVGLDNIQNVNGSVITFPVTGTYVLEFASDGSGAISINDLTQARISNRQNLVAAPAASIGVAGDLGGMVAYDATYMYLCTADYDGVSQIWIRSLAAVW